MKLSEKGLSSVIASVLMIFLVLVLASFIFSWARNFVSHQTENIESFSPKLCSVIDFSVSVVNRTGDYYDFEAVNRGNVDLDALRFRIYPGGDSNVVDSDVELLAGDSAKGSVELSGTIDRVEALGVLSGKIVCGNNPVDVRGV